MDIEIRDFRRFNDQDRRKPNRRLARADVYFPELETSINAVSLVWNRELRRFKLMTPFAKTPQGGFAINWNSHGVFVKSLTGQLIGMLEEELGEAFNPIKHAA